MSIAQSNGAGLLAARQSCWLISSWKGADSGCRWVVAQLRLFKWRISRLVVIILVPLDFHHVLHAACGFRRPTGWLLAIRWGGWRCEKSRCSATEKNGCSECFLMKMTNRKRWFNFKAILCASINSFGAPYLHTIAENAASTSLPLAAAVKPPPASHIW